MFRKVLTTFNPFFLILRWTIGVNTFYRIDDAVKMAVREEKKDLEKEFEDMAEGLVGNFVKQSIVLAVALGAVLVVHFGVPNAKDQLAGFLDDHSKMINGLVVAWFVISFGSVKKMFLSDATIVTFFMFGAFSIVWALMGLNDIYTQEPILREIGLTVTVFAWIASAMYDNMDFLKAGLDEAALDYYLQAKSALKVSIVEK